MDYKKLDPWGRSQGVIFEESGHKMGSEFDLKKSEAFIMANRDWTIAKNDLVYEIENLGFPADLGEKVARQLGSEKAMRRMIAYLHYVKPRKAELIVDEMLAICSDIENWKKKKAVEEANAKYNELLYYGIGRRED